MPNTRPVIDCGTALADLLERIARDAVVNVRPQASLTRGHGQEELSDFAELAAAVALTDDAFPIQSAALMRAALRRAAEIDQLVTVHCEDKSLTAGGVMNEGAVSRRLRVGGMPACAEDIMVARNLLLAQDVGARLHVLHVSTAGSVALLREARGMPVTSEACPHHFALTDEVVAVKGAQAKMNPPLRTAADVAAVKEGLRDGTIDAIATDHAPHAAEEKALGLSDAPSGILGLETALSLVLMELVEPGWLTLPQAIAKLTGVPAAILRIDRGTLAPGAVADVTVFDPTAEYRVDPEQLASKSKNTPWAGRTLRGRVTMTMVGGKVVYA
jgi:dihydroorotase